MYAPFVRHGDRLLLDWEAFAGHGELPLETFFDLESPSTTLLRVIASFEKRSETPSHLHALQLASLNGPVGIGYLPNDQLRFAEILDLESGVRAMEARDGKESSGKRTVRLTIQARFCEVAGFAQPVPLIQSIVRPNWFAP